MNLPRIAVLSLLLLGGLVQGAEPDEPRILVTFADPGMSNAARAGPARPAYSRRASTYLVSVGVRRAADRLARDFNLEVVDEWPIVPLNVHCLVYAVPADVALDTLLVRLQERPEVESAQSMNRFDVQGSPHPGKADPYAELQYNLQMLEVPAAHAWTRGAGSSVTIIDTGADLHHPELESQVRESHDFVGDDDDDFAADAHGTAIAGVIAAASGNGFGMVGIAPDTELTILRACWQDAAVAHAVCNSFTLAKALSHALGSKADVINLSLGGPHDALLSRLLSLALERGIVVVAAAPTVSGFPADVPGVIVVASRPGQDGAVPRLIAPGDEILVPVPGGGFDYASGTSLSAAHVSGIIALLMAERPGLGRAEVATLLAGSRADASTSVNACRALATLLRRDGCHDVAAAHNLP